MLAFFRKHKSKTSVFLLSTFLQGAFYNDVLALSSGPSQPETQQFVPAGIDDMVDSFTGDFNYNIPLIDVGGYPVNINYASGITPDAEASWVGLGWNLNVGAINRSVRGLPDDFAGDKITKEYDIKPNQTYGVSGNVNFEIFGFQPSAIKAASMGLSANLFYNNYSGFGMSYGVSPSVSAGLSSKSPFTGNLGLSASVGSQSGLEISPSLGLKYQQTFGESELSMGSSLGFPFNTREGLKGMTMSGSFNANTNYKHIKNNEKKSTHLHAGQSGSAFLGFAAPTYTPGIEHDMYNVNAALNFSFSSTDPATEKPAFGFGGYYAGQFLKYNSRTSPAYGYMYTGVTQDNDKLLDFNREKDGGAFNKFTQNLALTNFTYDIYQVSGQGIGGTYRLHRGDVGTVHDPITTDQGIAPGLGIDIGIGSPPSAKVALDATFNYTHGYSGPWPENNLNIKKFKSESIESLNNPGKEVAYFKKVGEMGIENDTFFFNAIQQGYKAINHKIVSGSKEGGMLTGQYETESKGTFTQEPVQGSNLRTVRKARTTSFTPLTAAEAALGNILPIQNYELNNFRWNNKSSYARSSDPSSLYNGYPKKDINRLANKPSHHTSEIRITDTQGARYVYGIPAYNNVQEEVTFALPGNSSNSESGIIDYIPGKDDAIGNKNGSDHFFNRVTTPPYAHSYLLTCVLSSDYVDSDKIKGPSDGDLGNYTKFNYTKAIERFKWRAPHTGKPNEASFSEGMFGSSNDDKANYVYGEKEIWYLHSIETKTHVAEFYVSDRLDGLGTTGRSGGIDEGNKLKKLDKIVLYSKPDKFNSIAVPIKTVHFKYDYSLCPNTPNSIASENNGVNKGKLTLKNIWFTYGKSLKGVMNPYAFNYADSDFDGDTDEALNPSYNSKSYDRWGNYKKEGESNGMPNSRFPYSIQEKSKADLYAAVYALSSINTPTGATMRVYYESDDYAYVQNKTAMRMFRISGASDNNSSTPEIKNTFTKSANIINPEFNDFLIVDLDEGFTPVGQDHNKEFRNKYLSGIDLLYYKVKLQVINQNLAARTVERTEFVSGYAEIDPVNSKLIETNKQGNNYKKAAIKLKRVKVKQTDNDDFHPIVKNGWMYARMHLNNELMGNANAQNGELEQILRGILSTASQITTFITRFSDQMLSYGHSDAFFPESSFIRLNEPDKIKLGGGHRVKAIVMSDNWGLMKSDTENSSSLPIKETSYYGQSYSYNLTENGSIISAGVAAYEPILGGEENPFRLPVFVREKVPLAPSREYYLEEPFGESFFPAPSVGYKKVVVTPLKLTETDLTNQTFQGNGTGRIEHEFYTAYDFPTITKRTPIRHERHRPNIISKFMKFDATDKVTASQGYYIELNDMHGKQAAQRVFPEGGSNKSLVKPVSELEYRYKKNNDNSLNNKVSYINRDLSLSSSQAEMGVDVDVVHDERYFESTTIGGGLQLNLKYIQAAIIPLFIPTPYPDFSNEQTGFRSLVTTKVVNKYAILKSITSKENGASIVTENLAYDSQTGEVLLKSVQNEFHDPIFTFTFPGHWVYERMNFSSLNESFSFNASGYSYSSEVKNSVKDGDELILSRNNGESKLVHFNGVSPGGKFIDSAGTTVQDFTSAKIIRSGSRNMVSIPVGTIVALDNPISSGKDLVFTRVLNANSIEFSDAWKKFCDCPAGGTEIKNPYLQGLKGSIRPIRSWAYLTGRNQTLVNNNPNLRSDGYYTGSFVSFWQKKSASNFLVAPSDFTKSPWQFVTETQNYNSKGSEIENKDAIGRYSMAQFGYGGNLPVATSNNSKYQETGFDGFEDYDYGNCNDDHLSFRNFKELISDDHAHSGRKSIKVRSGALVQINKVVKKCNE